MAPYEGDIRRRFVLLILNPSQLSMKHCALIAFLTLSTPLRALAGFSVQQDAYDAGLFTPVEDLHSLSVSDFTALSHPAFPNYNVRIKTSDFCDGIVVYVLIAEQSQLSLST